MDKEGKQRMTDDIYVNADAVRGQTKKETEDSHTLRIQPPQIITACEKVKMRSSRAVPVCLVLLYFILLTAVIVLCVHIYTSNTNYTQERNQLLTRITNLTGERDELLTKITNITKQLLVWNSEVTKERDQLLTRTTNLTEERDQLLTENIQLTKERNELLLDKMDGWICYQSSSYFISSKVKNWSESRRDCQQRGADLTIINNKQEQDFIKCISNGELVWIGLTDSDVEGKWEWVDGSEVTSGFWNRREPGGGRGENCALNHPSGWADYPCSDAFQWTCEKNIKKFV